MFHGGRYASCVHAGELSCSISGWRDPTFYFPAGLLEQNNDRKFHSPNNLHGQFEVRNIRNNAWDKKPHSAIAETNFPIIAREGTTLSRKNDLEMVGENSDKAIDAIDLDSIQFTSLINKVQSRRSDDPTEREQSSEQLTQ